MSSSHDLHPHDLERLFDAVARGQRAEAVLRAEAERAAFRTALSDALRVLSDPVAIEAAVTRMLGEHLGLAHAHYATVSADGQHAIVERDWAARGAPPMAGAYAMSDFEAIASQIRAGRTLVVRDTRSDETLPPEVRERMAALAFASFVSVPLVRHGRLAAFLVAGDDAPRDWTAHEVELVEDVAQRAWVALERGRVEGALRASEERGRLALDAAGMGSFVWLPDQDRTEADARLLELFGLPPDGSISLASALSSLIHPDDRDRYAAAVARAIDPAGDRTLREEIRVRRADGERWLRVVAQATFAGARPLHLAGVAGDVTDRKRAEEELERLVRSRTLELQASNEQLEAFVYSVSHDLRAPLRSLTGYSELLLDEQAERLDASGREMLKRIHTSALFLDRLLLDLLWYGRTARAELELGAVDVGEAWQAAQYQCEADLERTRAAVETRGALPQVRAHLPTLGQVLANLLLNAIRFVPDDRRPRVRFHAEDRGDAVRLWLEDNGIGIEPEHHQRIFRLFERLHGARYGGTGIGLFIVRKAVERMDGTVGVESTLGEGSRFWIELPKP